mmetsp:Transcript_37935/g.100941  ORF Transcript_37935/g.100941 Transcript_37935/m.100941 type:complete len:210 (-) Transcript_37935:2845-3474(-)
MDWFRAAEPRTAVHLLAGDAAVGDGRAGGAREAVGGQLAHHRPVEQSRDNGAQRLALLACGEPALRHQGGIQERARGHGGRVDAEGILELPGRLAGGGSQHQPVHVAPHLGRPQAGAGVPQHRLRSRVRGARPGAEHFHWRHAGQLHDPEQGYVPQQAWPGRRPVCRARVLRRLPVAERWRRLSVRRPGRHNEPRRDGGIQPRLALRRP